MGEPEQEMTDELEHETVVDEVGDPPARAKRWRIGLLAVLFVGSLIVAKVTGVHERFDVDEIRALMVSAGAWGFVAFVALFTLGELMHVPGMVFVGAAAFAYGKVLGSLAGYTGALGSVLISFLLIRTIGGQPLGSIRWHWVRKMLDRLEARPIRTVAILRAIFWLAPALNYGLAMTKVRLKDYLIGSAIGLAIPVPLAVIFFDWIVARWP